ncbi:MAG: hypothetical protein LBO72_02030 [Helicobacteraceae bacterium]|jgi:hypothetical protein|nr:hypothetical protein [Helicobacteraceae bacterium]
MRYFTKILSICVALCALNVKTLNAGLFDEIVGGIEAEGYFMGATGGNVSGRSQFGKDRRYGVKLGYGSEEFDVISGSAEHEYWQVALQRYWGDDFFALYIEPYYRSSISSKISGNFQAEKIDPYFGVNFGVEGGGSDWAIGLTVGIFSPPSLNPKDDYWNEGDDDITPITIGINYTYFFGND